jgi:hypothetical protein
MVVTVEGGFQVKGSGGAASTIYGAVLSLARRTLEALRLVPRTLKGRARIKRLVYGKLRVVPPELNDGFAARAPTTVLAPGSASEYKVLYVKGVKTATSA